MIGGNPDREMANSNNSGVRVTAAYGSGPVPQRFMQNAVIPGGVSNPLVEDRNVLRVFVSVVKRLKIDVSGEGSFRSDDVKKRLDQYVDATDDGPNGAKAGMHHDEITAADTEPPDVISEFPAGEHESIIPAAPDG
jgi:hypothetical protein